MAFSDADNALGWLIGVARHKAVDRLRREAVRAAKEAASVRETGESAAGLDASPQAADTLSPMPAGRRAATISATWCCSRTRIAAGGTRT